MHQYHYFDLNTHNVVPGRACDYCGDLDFLTLTKIIKPTTQVSYEYEKVRKAIDTFYGLYQEGYDDDFDVVQGDVWWAFYDTARISKRSEQYKQLAKNGGTYTGATNVQSYSYAGKYIYSNEEIVTKDETGYTFRDGTETIKEVEMIEKIKSGQEYTATIVNPGYTQTQTVYKNSKPIKEVVTDLKTKQVQTTTYTYNDTRYPDKPTYIQTAITVPGKASKITSKEIYYESNWGYVERETNPLDKLTQYSNATLKQKNTIWYTYDKKFGFQTSKKYYQNTGNTILTEQEVYDSYGRKTQSIDPSGKVTYYTYPAISAQYPGNAVKVYDLDEKGVTNTLVTYTYDTKTNSVIEKETETLKDQTRITTYGYERIHDKKTFEIDANNKKTMYQYYPDGKLRLVIYPTYKDKDNKEYYKQEVYHYRQVDVPIALINRALCEIKLNTHKIDISTKQGTFISADYTFCDDNGRVWRTYTRDILTNIDYNITDYLRGANNEIVTYRTRNLTGEYTSDWIIYKYDGMGRQTKATDCNDNQYIITYNDLEQSKLVEFIPKGGTSENHYKEYYDIQGNVIKQEAYPNGINGQAVRITREYDLLGNVIKVVNPKGYITKYEYNALNQLTKEIDAEGHINQYTYDKDGNNLTVTQREGSKDFTYTNAFNSANELTKTISPSGKVTVYTYDKVGNILSEAISTGKITNNTYYGTNKIATETIGNSKRTYYYDTHEALTGITTVGVGQSIQKSYTGNGLIATRSVGNLKTNFKFDVKSNLSTLTDPFGLKVTYTPDHFNQVTDIAVDNKNFVYDYYPDGTIKSITMPVGSGKLVSNHTYDNMNRLKVLQNTLNGTVISTYSYTYDANSNIIKIVESEKLTTGKIRNRTSNYTYDKLDQLLTVNSTDGRNIAYTYDSRGNRSIKNTAILSLESEELVEEADVIAPQAEILTSQFTDLSFGYNDFDELSKCAVEDKFYTYTYDAEGIRITKVLNTGATKYYHNNNGEVIAETDASGKVTAQNIWTDRILARKVNNQYYYYVTNGHGDITQIVNEQGKLVNTYQYDEWGNILDQAEGISNPIRYAGEYYDEETGLYYLRARYYDPSTGRFIGEDPARDGSNWYIYCYNNPLKYVDPSGNVVETILDVINTASSAKDFMTNPGLKTGATLVWDVGATIAPGVPGSYAKKGTQVGAKVATKVAPKLTKTVEKASKKVLTSFDDVANYIKKYGKLPDNYIGKNEAEKLGWVSKKGNLNKVAPNKSIGGDIYYNRNKLLPSASGRTWYEADINYSSGRRGSERIVYSSDGLIYKTSDHYETFIQIK